MVSLQLIIGAGALVAVIACVILWRYASKLAALAEEEQQWVEYIRSLEQTDPSQAAYWREMFEQRFVRKG